MAELLRSPQFSEEADWLPPWLQPHRASRAEDRFDRSLSQEVPECLVSYHKTTSAVESPSHLVAEWDCKSKLSPCCLFLSEGSNTYGGSTQSPGNVMDLDLHLSSEGFSQIPSNPRGSCSQVRSNAPTEVLVKEVTSEVVQVEVSQSTVEDTNCKENLLAIQCLPELCISNEKHMVEIPVLEHHHNVKVELQKKRSKGKLKPIVGPCSDIFKFKKQKYEAFQRPQEHVIGEDEAVELCIAASEAVVISELSKSSNEFELSSESVVGVALLVKQARNQCQLEVQALSTNQCQQNDETEELSCLDSYDMEKALDDVGIALTEIILHPDNVGDKCSSQTCHMNECPVGLEDTDCQGTKGPVNARFTGSDYFTSNPKIIRENDVDLKDCIGAMTGDNFLKKGVANIFVAQTSTFSESNGTIGEGTSVQLKMDFGSVPFSNKDSADACKSFSGRNKETNHLETNFPQDFVGSSNFSQMDPLCSVVPCSFPPDNSFIDHKENAEKTEKIEGPVTFVPFPGSHGKSALVKDDNAVTFSPFVKMGESSKFKFQAEISGVTLKCSNSLRVYSMGMATESTKFSNANFLQNKSSNPLIVDSEKAATECLQHRLGHSDPLKKQTGIPTIIPFEDELFHDSHSCRRIKPKLPYPTLAPTVEGVACLPNTEKQNGNKCTSPISCKQSQHCMKVCSTNTTEQQCITLKGSTVAKKSRRESARVSSFHGGAVIKSCLTYRSKSRSVTLKELNAASKCVRFSLSEASNKQSSKLSVSHGQKNGLNTRMHNKKKISCQFSLQKCPKLFTKLAFNGGNNPIFYGLEFLVTGFTRRKKIEVENIIILYGGVVLPSIPRLSNVEQKKRLLLANQHYQVVISPKKVQTIEFLYGCAINTWILSADWLFDSVKSSHLLPPAKYLILPNMVTQLNFEISQVRPFVVKEELIFYKLAVMLHGKASFCSKFSTIIKHGGGQIFKSLQSLSQNLKGRLSIGAVVVEDDNAVSRHLKYCALEHNLQTVSVNWVVNSLFSGKLLPLKRDRSLPLRRIKMPTFANQRELEMSEEI